MLRESPRVVKRATAFPGEHLRYAPPREGSSVRQHSHVAAQLAELGSLLA